jgi:hypothetical protein
MMVILMALALSSSPAIIEFSRTGGLAAFEDRVELRRDELAIVITHGNKRSLKVKRKDVQSLVQQLKDTALFDRDRSYLSDGADHIVYTITYDGHTLRASDDRIPLQLQVTIQRLVRMIEASDRQASWRGAKEIRFGEVSSLVRTHRSPTRL